MSEQDIAIAFTDDLSHTALAAQMHRQCFPKSWDQASFNDAMTIPGTIFQLLSHHDSPAAFALYRAITDEAEILTLGVLPAFRQQGLGAVLLDRGIDYLRSRNVTQLWLDVGSRNFAAVALYGACGFSEAGRRKNYYTHGADTEDAIVMKRYLSAGPH